MYVEDYIKKLFTLSLTARVTLTDYEIRFITDMMSYVNESRPLTTKQVDLAVKILNDYRMHLLDDYFKQVLLDKKCRNIPVPSSNAVIPREVRYVGNNTFVFRFKYDTKIKNFISKLQKSNWDHINKVWTVMPENPNDLFTFIANFGFEPDDSVLEYFALTEDLKKTTIEMLDENNIFIVARNQLAMEFMELMEIEE